MAYTPTNWVDGTTPVNEANLDKMETGIDQAHDAIDTITATSLPAKENKSEKGQANGYASLDATTKVPLAQLPPVGADLVYNGAWAPGTYEDGDIVVHNGIEYMAVKVTTATPDPAPWAAVGLGVGGMDYVGTWAAGTVYYPGQVVRHNGIDYVAVNPSQGQTPPTVFGPVGAAYGTSLPASPIDGQEYTLVDSLTAPTYAWRFRYSTAITDLNKWVFIGGAPMSAYVGADEATSSGTYVDLATVQARTISRGGLYSIRWGCVTYAMNGGYSYQGLFVGGALFQELAVGGLTAQLTMGVEGPVAIGAGQEVRLRYHGSASQTPHFQSRQFAVTPVRVA